MRRLAWLSFWSPPRVDPERVRDELSRTDPDFARVRDAQHDALNVIGARRGARGLAASDRWNARVRDSWRPQSHDA